MIDEPDVFVLWATLDSGGRKGKIRSIWFRLPGREDDLVLEFFKGGAIGVTSVAVLALSFLSLFLRIA
jgi:hypothetical protein